MLRTHKIHLNPTNAQAATLTRYMGASRWVYNQAKEISEKYYQETGKGLSKFNLRNKIVQDLKPLQPWLYDIPKGVTIYAVFNYYDALERFFKHQNKYPKFKTKKNGIGSFSVENDQIKVFGKKIRFPLIGWIKMAEECRFKGKIKTVTVTQHNYEFFVSLTLETEYTPLPQTGAVVGIDVNLSAIVDSDRNHHFQPRAYKAYERKLTRFHKSVSRKQKGSQNQKKAIRRLANTQKRVANIRFDFAHKLSYQYINANSIIGVETLSIANMLKNHNLAKNIQDAGFGQFLNILKYKAIMNERLVVEANRFYPSSKRCSSCGTVRTKLSLGERLFMCSACGFEANRDENAATNLMQLAIGSMESINACGEDIRRVKQMFDAQSSMKQEAATVL